MSRYDIFTYTPGKGDYGSDWTCRAQNLSPFEARCFVGALTCGEEERVRVFTHNRSGVGRFVSDSQDRGSYPYKPCEYCGRPGTATNPTALTLISPPVDGHRVVRERMHKRCATRCAAAHTH